MFESTMLPRIVAEESDPEILRAYVQFMASKIKEQEKRIEILEKEKAQRDQLLIFYE